MNFLTFILTIASVMENVSRKDRSTLICSDRRLHNPYGKKPTNDDICYTHYSICVLQKNSLNARKQLN